MKLIIALFGPPGVGKTTLIRTAKSHRIPAIDLEDVSSSTEERRAYVQNLFSGDYVHTMIIGAADLHQNDFPDFVETVLLLPEKNTYLQRMEMRDSDMPHKAEQNGDTVYDLFAQSRQNFDRVITETGTPEQILETLLDSAGERT